MPARLIDASRLSIVSNKKKLSFGELINETAGYKYQNNSNDKKEALADMFGDINNQNRFPHFNGEGVSGNTIACLRMLSRFFDLPFRKDILKE